MKNDGIMLGLSGAMMVFRRTSLVMTMAMPSACVGEAHVGSEEEPEDIDGEERREPLDCTGYESDAVAPEISEGSNAFGALENSHWQGYAEGAAEPSMARDIDLKIGPDGKGVIRFGALRDFSPPTNPDVGYLCDGVGTRPISCDTSRAVDGWEYAIYDASFDGRRFRFSFSLSAPWSDWCQLQTPYLHERDRCEYQAIPEYEFMTGGVDGCYLDGVKEVDCGWTELVDAMVICACNSSECFVDGPSMKSFDLAMDSDAQTMSDAKGVHLFVID